LAQQSGGVVLESIVHEAWEVSSMSLLLAGAAGTAVGVLIGRWRSLWLPVVLGSVVIFGIASTNSPSQESPAFFVAILVAMATLGTVLGTLLRQRLGAHQPDR
jgi:hypothetical protein